MSKTGAVGGPIQARLLVRWELPHQAMLNQHTTVVGHHHSDSAHLTPSARALSMNVLQASAMMGCSAWRQRAAWTCWWGRWTAWRQRTWVRLMGKQQQCASCHKALGCCALTAGHCSLAVVKTTDNPEGLKVPTDMFVVASGCHYNLNPPFLHELGIGEGHGACPTQYHRTSRGTACLQHAAHNPLS